MLFLLFATISLISASDDGKSKQAVEFLQNFPGLSETSFGVVEGPLEEAYSKALGVDKSKVDAEFDKTNEQVKVTTKDLSGDKAKEVEKKANEATLTQDMIDNLKNSAPVQAKPVVDQLKPGKVSDVKQKTELPSVPSGSNFDTSQITNLKQNITKLTGADEKALQDSVKKTLSEKTGIPEDKISVDLADGKMTTKFGDVTADQVKKANDVLNDPKLKDDINKNLPDSVKDKLGDSSAPETTAAKTPNENAGFSLNVLIGLIIGVAFVA